MKKIIVFLMFSLATISFSKIEIKIFEPLRFEYLNSSQLSREQIAAHGTIEIKANEEDYGKKITFDFPKAGFMTNRKKWIKIERYGMELPDNELIITQEIQHVKFYGLLNRRDIDQGEDAKIIEGEYTGYVPIIVSEYSSLEVAE